MTFSTSILYTTHIYTFLHVNETVIQYKESSERKSISMMYNDVNLYRNVPACMVVSLENNCYRVSFVFPDSKINDALARLAEMLSRDEKVATSLSVTPCIDQCVI